MSTKKYVGLKNLTTFLNNLKNTFATLTHKHKLEDITDYTVDSELSSTSINPVQNKVINAEFDAIGESLKGYADSVSATAANAVKDDLLNGAGGAYDTLKELGDLIDENTDAIDALEIIATGKADAQHTHDDRYYTEAEVEEIIATHTHSYDDLRNKPFYEGTDYSSIFANGTSTVSFYEWGDGVYGAAVTDAPQVFTQGVSHKVIWDGVEYTMTSAYAGDNESGNQIISIGAPYGDYSIYPFGIDSYQTSSGAYEFSVHTNSTASTHTIDILELGSSFVTIDERFIPDSIARTIDVDEAINEKADIDHTHNNIYYTKSEIDNLELITVEDIDEICGSTIEYASLSEGVF